MNIEFSYICRYNEKRRGDVPKSSYLQNASAAIRMFLSVFQFPIVQHNSAWHARTLFLSIKQFLSQSDCCIAKSKWRKQAKHTKWLTRNQTRVSQVFLIVALYFFLSYRAKKEYCFFCVCARLKSNVSDVHYWAWSLLPACVLSGQLLRRPRLMSNHLAIMNLLMFRVGDDACAPSHCQVQL